MYIALTEQDAVKIRNMGISVIEWKNCMRKNIKIAVYAIEKVVEKIVYAWNMVIEAAEKAFDLASLVIEEIKDRLNYPTSRRYKFVKILGAMGYDKQRVWTLTRHSWLARSNC